MAKQLSDTEVAEILHRATGMIAPVLDVLEHSDPFTDGDSTGPAVESDAEDAETFSAKAIDKVADSLAWVTNAATAPGSEKWEALSVDERTDWWVNRVGALTAVLVAYPGVFGAAADRLPIQDVLGFTQQAFVLCAVARVHGVTDRARQTDLLASVLCGRTLASSELLGAAAEKLAVEPVAAPVESRSMTRSARDVVRRIWSTAQLLRAVTGEAKRRPRPSRLWRTLSAVPVVGAAADYVGERSALKAAVTSGVDWLRAGDSSAT